MNEIFYSIIIPHHNIPKLLQRLLDSIPQRNDTEIIVVDDNSSSDIVDFEHFPGYNRADVQLIFDKRGGYGGYARNIGLSVARGKWILFADSDDYFNYCINDILNEYHDLDHQTDIVFFNANSVDCEKYTNSNRCNLLNNWITAYYNNSKSKEIILRYRFGEPWCKLIRRSLIIEQNIRFEERSIHNDTAFSYLVGFHARSIKVDERALYCITTRIGSVSKEISEKKKLERIENFGSSARFFTNHGIPIHETRHFHQLYKCKKENTNTFNDGMKILHRLGFSTKEIKEGLNEEFRKQIKTNVKNTIKVVISMFLQLMRKKNALTKVNFGGGVK